ncbi:MAG: BPL-N domain-containing protein [Proteobacteria bacterium]|nr:BPL-N domain-containing protein [Pseudomonadota bacterium]
MFRRIRIFSLVFSAILFNMSSISSADTVGLPGQNNGGSDKYALVYNGPVSAEDCPEAVAAIAKNAGLKVRFVSIPGDIPRLLDNAAVFIIGGTEDDMGPMVKAFTPKVVTSIKEYLRKGGRYLGICGGGFMASTGWKEGSEYMKGFGIIPAEAKVFQDSFEAKILPVKWLGKMRPMFFKAGPDFRLTKTQETVHVVATYGDGSVAALMSTYGKGRVAVCGPHPEARESWKDDAGNSDRWVSSTDLAVQFLKYLLSDRPLGK